MKKAKALQRFWAFLLVFVLVATTLGNDSLTVVAAERETITEQAEEPAPALTAEADENKSGGERGTGSRFFSK